MPTQLAGPVLFWSSCLVLFAACGGDDSESRLASELDAAERDARCSEWDSRATGDPDTLEGFCRIRAAARALFDPQLASMDPIVVCEMETQRCLGAPPVDFCRDGIRDECTASVDEIDTCVDVSVSQWRMAASRTCEAQLARLMEMRQAQQTGVPFDDPTADACRPVDECFLTVVAPTRATGGAGAGSAGASGAGAGSPPSFTPDAMCLSKYPNPNLQCAMCVCSPGSPGTPGCFELYDNCYDNADPTYAMLCGALVTCMIETGCVGSACYAPQQCMTEIDAAAMHPNDSTLASCNTDRKSVV